MQSLFEHFLKRFFDICEETGTPESAAMLLIFYFTKKSASYSLKACLSSKKIRATVLHDERVSSYVKIFNSLLTPDATDDISVRAIEGLEPSLQASDVFVVLYASRVYTKALRSGIFY